MTLPRAVRHSSTAALSIIGCLLVFPSLASDGDVRTINADVYGDNWFAVYVGDTLVVEDSVPYNTERSFNAESVSFDVSLPAHVSVVMKDFKENDSGLEYIGTPRVQIGDGGLIAQFFDAESGELVAASDESWRCLTIHRAPINRSCLRSDDPENDCQSDIDLEPEGWMLADFDDSEWPQAIVHSAEAVEPRHGYDLVRWNPAAKFIWGEDLEIDNTILCRFEIEAR
jgi:hypothetical protein